MTKSMDLVKEIAGKMEELSEIIAPSDEPFFIMVAFGDTRSQSENMELLFLHRAVRLVDIERQVAKLKQSEENRKPGDGGMPLGNPNLN